MKFESSVTNAIAQKFIRVDSNGAVFETEPHPDRLDGMVICWDGIGSINKMWDRNSNLIQTFESGGRMFIPAYMVKQMLMEAYPEIY